MLRLREMEWVYSRLLVRIYHSSLRVKQPCLGKLSDGAIKQMGSVSSVSHLCDKKPSQKQLEGEGLMLTHRFSVPSSMVETLWQLQALAATGHTVSMARKQRQWERSAPFLVSTQSGTPNTGHFYPPSHLS